MERLESAAQVERMGAISPRRVYATGMPHAPDFTRVVDMIDWLCVGGESRRRNPGEHAPALVPECHVDPCDLTCWTLVRSGRETDASRWRVTSSATDTRSTRPDDNSRNQIAGPRSNLFVAQWIGLWNRHMATFLH